MLSLAAYLHRLDPFLLELGGGFGIRWYGLSYLAGFVLAYYLIRRVTRVGVSTLVPEQVADMVVAGAIGIFLGGRLGYALFYDRELFYTFSSSPPWWNLLAIHRGGMASHGGILGFMVAMVVFARRRGHSWGHLMDLGAFACPIGLGFGRVANFINGELYGRPCSPDFPLAVLFPRELVERSDVDLQMLAPLLPPVPPSRQTGLEDQILRAIQEGNAQVIEAVTPLLTPRHPSQLYEALLEGLVVFLVLALIWTRPRRPLVVGGSFLAVYGVMRIGAEFFREPDEGIALVMGLSRGQWLSIPLVLAGLVIALLAARRKVAPMGGWMKGQETSAAGAKR